MISHEEFFFGENFRTFRQHVVKTAWIFVAIDLILILLLSGIFNLTVGKFDAFSILLSLLFISVLGSAVYGIVVRRYIFIWPILLCKAAEVAITVIILIIAFLLLLFDRSFLVHVIAMRISTIEGENVSHYRETLHITFAFIYLFCQLFYCLVIFYVFFNVMDYFRKRTLFAYRQRLTPTYDFITRIHSVRHSESRVKSTPDRLLQVDASVLEMIEEESSGVRETSPLRPSPSPPQILPASSMTQSFTAPQTVVSHSVRLSSQRRFSCQRDASTDCESRSSGGMLSSAIHKITADRQLSVPLTANLSYWGAVTAPASRTRARTLNDDVIQRATLAEPVPSNARRGSSDGVYGAERRDSQGRSQSVFNTNPMSMSLHEPRAQSHDDRQHYSTHRYSNQNYSTPGYSRKVSK